MMMAMFYMINWTMVISNSEEAGTEFISWLTGSFGRIFQRNNGGVEESLTGDSGFSDGGYLHDGCDWLSWKVNTFTRIY